MKTRGWYLGKGSHKKDVEVTLVHVVTGQWGSRIRLSEKGTRRQFDITLTPEEVPDLICKLEGATIAQAKKTGTL